MAMLQRLAHSWAVLESALLRAFGLQQRSAPALAIQAPAAFPQFNPEARENHQNDSPGFLDSIFLMAAPKKRRTIEVNRCRRRDVRKLEKVKNNIEVCQECGHLKLKHVLCAFCYQKVAHETALVRAQIQVQEGRPLNTAAIETVVLYEGEKATEADKGKRIIERNRKRPSWFTVGS
ncbi:39S ribosomal protein L32, mitochondrial [Pristis pectinata]|uniref:39S ribosomal protein L32, mitochondrial n=1 Tax=Pristis pectinata TaxID=685728 RepID=UPI00223CBC42|nr:39S ribosomal protein L32, mitochondrial [Pristis pectinata]XP_051872950.1 39S ribosomal protein L32, mitochondrial [Pristis pectinata]